MERREFQMIGMNCTGCERILEGQLGDIDGVSFVDADAHSGTLAVAAAESALDPVKELARRLGYDIEGRRVDP